MAPTPLLPNGFQTAAGLPAIAISLGDPFGIGPEIVVKSLYDSHLRSFARYRIFGSVEALNVAAKAAEIAPFWRRIEAGDVPVDDPGCPEVSVIDSSAGPEKLPTSPVPPGPTPGGGQASYRWVEQAIRCAQLPATDPAHAKAIVTAPISKTSWDLAGKKQFPGHTELFATRFGVKRSGMLFVGPSLRVMLATIHVPLMRVREVLTLDKVLEAIELADQACRDLGVARPRIAVAGLNPHAGEGGILGDDESRIISPAVRAANGAGIDVKGPFPGDTVFNAAAAPPHGRGLFDCVVAMYHDQGLIPVKLLDGKLAVNVTVGLPIIRTSPAHGTAFDIAGRNIADPSSMRAAIELALKMIAHKDS